MVLFRITGMFAYGPVFGSRTIPTQIKILLALGLSFCVYPMLLEPAAASFDKVMPIVNGGLSLWTLGGAVAMEMMIGLVIGFGATLPLIGIQVGGRVIDQQMGLGIAGVFNPDLDEQTGVISEFLFIMALTTFVILGGHRVLLATVVGSFHHVPLGGFQADGRMLDLIVGLLASMFELGARISAPLLCFIFLETVAMGFIARTVPQMNILSIGFALRIVAGSIMLLGAIGVMAAVFETNMTQTLRKLMTFFAP